MATTNFKFQKRQKELERKKKNEEKMQRKQERSGAERPDSPDEAADEGSMSKAE
jgi:hypothetical protein